MMQADRPRSERKARGSGHLRRAELLAAAEKIFTVAGYEGATIRKIAEEVGVSSTALYMYFQDKSQIMLEICVHALEGLHRQLEAISAEKLEPLAKVRAMLEVMLRFGFDQPTAYQLLYCVAPKEINERRNEVIAPLSRSCFHKMQKAIEDAIAAGQLRGDMPGRAVAEAVVASCHGLIGMRLANPYAPWAESDLMRQVLLDGLFEGFGPRR
ncbi:MAG TPA: TetR/AcrR family transcriptional regulator [Caulobacteraceae bacterium]|jgi:AcrR family transcriptional regulator